MRPPAGAALSPLPGAPRAARGGGRLGPVRGGAACGATAPRTGGGGPEGRCRASPGTERPGRDPPEGPGAGRARPAGARRLCL